MSFENYVENIYIGEHHERNDFDISNMLLDKSYATGYGFQGLYINPDENIALTCQFNNSSSVLRKYNYTDKDISKCQLEDTYSTYARTHCIFANKTGTHIYIGTHENNYVYEYNTTNCDLDSQHMSLYKSKNMGHIIQSIWISDDERYLIVCNPDSTSSTTNPSEFWLYEMSTPGDISTATLIKSGTNVLGYNVHGIFFNPEMTQYVACEYSSSSGTIHKGTWNILENNSTPTETSSSGALGFTVGYVNINKDATTLYCVNESGYIYQFNI